METVNQEINTAEEQGTENRTFTQDEVNAIVADRMRRYGAKFADYDALKEKAEKYDQAEEASKTELQRQTERADKLQAEYDNLTRSMQIKEMRSKVSKETGVPENLLMGETEEACKEQANAILAFAKPGQYPVLKDSGEVQRVNNNKRSTRDQFAEALNGAMN